MTGGDEFYVGYLPHAPARLARRTKMVVAALGALFAGAALLLAAAQREYGPGIFEFGRERAFEGTIVLDPQPILLVDRPGAAAAPSRESSYLIVAPGKHGARGLLVDADRRRVRLRGTLAWREGGSLIELVPGSVELLPASGIAESLRVPLGTVRLRGEIVDAKCYLGVMNPGNGKPHRACAARCLSGGVPPLFVARDRRGRTIQMLLVGADGGALNRDLLDIVAEPVEIVGEAERLGDLLVLRADRASIVRRPG